MHRRFAIASYLPLLDPTLAWATRRHHVLPQMPLFDNDDQGGGGGGGGGKDKKKKLTDLLSEDEELQEQFDSIFERRLARERKKLGAGGGKGDGLTQEERDELQRLRDAEETRKTEEATRKGEFDKVLNAEREKWGTKEKNLTQRLDKLGNELKRDRVRSKLVSAAAAAGAIDPEEVADLLERRVKFDLENLAITVLKDDGQSEALNSEGDAMSIEDLVGGYLSKKKHLAKAAEGEGSGSRGGKSKSSDGQQRKEKPEIATLRKAYEDAKEAAHKPFAGSAAITKMQKAKKALDEAERAAA